MFGHGQTALHVAYECFHFRCRVLLLDAAEAKNERVLLCAALDATGRRADQMVVAVPQFCGITAIPPNTVTSFWSRRTETSFRVW
jgi:hypothetical protein